MDTHIHTCMHTTAVAVEAAAVSVERASASGTRDGEPRISVFLTVI